jgi:hypothetical protein
MRGPTPQLLAGADEISSRTLGNYIYIILYYYIYYTILYYFKLALSRTLRSCRLLPLSYSLVVNLDVNTAIVRIHTASHCVTSADIINTLFCDLPLGTSDAPKLGQELLHNVHMIVQLAESELHSVRRRAAAESERAAVLQRDAAAAKQRVEAGAQRLKRLEQVTCLCKNWKLRLSCTL